jgi:uncharacterized protein (DUF2236 family)
MVNHVHTQVRGDGYHALDPELLLWVHATLVDTALVVYETFVKRLLPAERRDFYQEMKLLGELLGVPRDRFPEHLSDFNAYVDAMISNGVVAVDARSFRLAREIMRPKVRVLPGPALIPLEIVTAGLLPPALREQFCLPWGPRRQRAYRLAVKTLPTVIALTPPVLRVWPLPGHHVTLKIATS